MTTVDEHDDEPELETGKWASKDTNPVLKARMQRATAPSPSAARDARPATRSRPAYRPIGVEEPEPVSIEHDPAPVGPVKPIRVSMPERMTYGAVDVGARKAQSAEVVATVTPAASATPPGKVPVASFGFDPSVLRRADAPAGNPPQRGDALAEKEPAVEASAYQAAPPAANSNGLESGDDRLAAMADAFAAVAAAVSREAAQARSSRRAAPEPAAIAQAGWATAAVSTPSVPAPQSAVEPAEVVWSTEEVEALARIYGDALDEPAAAPPAAAKAAEPLTFESAVSEEDAFEATDAFQPGNEEPAGQAKIDSAEDDFAEVSFVPAEAPVAAPEPAALAVQPPAVFALPMVVASPSTVEEEPAEQATVAAAPAQDSAPAWREVPSQEPATAPSTSEGNDSPALAALNQFLSEHRSAAATASPSTASSSMEAAVAEISARISSIETRLVELSNGQVAAGAIERIESCIAEFKEQQARTLEGLGRLTTIESSLNRMASEALKNQPDWPALAQRLAEAVARQQPQAQPAADPKLAEKLAAIEALLAEYEHQRRSDDEQIAGAIETIHAIVADLSARLDAYEHEPMVEEMPFAAPAPVAAPARAARSAAVGFTQTDPRLPTQPAMFRPVAAPEARSAPEAPAQAEAEADGDVGYYDEAGELALASAPALDMDLDPELAEEAASEGVSREDLVAQARRAAVSATGQRPARQAAPRPAARSLAPQSQPRKSLLSAAGSSRPVLIVAVLALIAAGAGMIYNKVMHKPQAASALIEQTTVPADAATPTKSTRSPEQSMLDEAAPAEGGPESTLSASDIGLEAAAPDAGRSSTAPKETTGVRITSLTPDAGVSLAQIVNQDGSAVTDASVPPAGTDGGAQALGDASAPAAASDGKGAESGLPPAAIAPLSVRLAATQGDVQAQLIIADRFAAGTGVPKDYEQAALWYQRAASSGSAIGQYRLASLYERGRGVDQDLGRARIWYQRAAEQGHVKAMHNLGVLYTGQSGNNPDYETAAKWFAKAAEYGLPDSEFNLAILYENGLGIARSTEEAYKWYALAARAGDEEAARRRDMVRARLSPAVLATVNKAIKGWKPKEEAAAAKESASAAETAQPQTAVAPVPAAVDPATQVAGVQTMLNKLGYDVGPVDGVLASRTKDAIVRFQKRSGLKPTGEITDELVLALKELAG